MYGINSSHDLEDFLFRLLKNACQDDSLRSEDLFQPLTLSNPLSAYIFMIFFTVVVLSGVVGSSLVMYIVVTRKAMHNVLNVLICNLAISDLVMSVFGVPFTVASVIMKQWVFGEQLCHVVPAIPGCMVVVSSLTFSFIAIDRFLRLVHPYNTNITKTGGSVILVVIWSVGILTSIPIGMNHTEADFTAAGGGLECIEYWNNYELRSKYNIFLLCIHFCVPLLVVSVSHIAIAIKYYNGKWVRRRSNAAQRKTRLALLLVSMVLAFFICWLPLNIYQLLDIKSCANHIEFLAIYLLAASNASLNPLLYAGFNINFRNEVKYLAARLKEQPSRRSSRTTRTNTIQTTNWYAMK